MGVASPGPVLDQAHAREALELARRGAGQAAPNPLVGALVVRDGEIVGRGTHLHASRDHAEVVALHEAGARASGATLYVSLEPCSSHGRTPPCTEAIVAAGIRRVVACMADPDPRHCGAAVESLRSRGIEVEIGLLRDEAILLNEKWLKKLRTGLPHVTVKLATSLDGRLAAASTGATRWLTGSGARRQVHALRRAADAVLCGIGTVIADDPRLTVRLSGATGRAPRRVVLDPTLRTPPGARLLAAASEPDELAGSAILFTCEGSPSRNERRADELRKAGAEIVEVATLRDGGRDWLDLPAVLSWLARSGVDGLLVEGGGVTAGRFVAGHLADRLALHVAPLLLGSEGTTPAFASFGSPSIEAAPRVRRMSTTREGDDVLFEGLLDGGFDAMTLVDEIAAMDAQRP